MWKIFALLTLSIATVFAWMCAELGFFGSMPVYAKEQQVEVGTEVRKNFDNREKGLRQREEIISRKEREVSDREKLLAQQISRYEKVIQELTGRVGELENLRADKADSFRGVFEKMESKKASKILEEMDPKVAGAVVSSLKKDKAGDILSAMAPEKARAIAEFVLGKRAPSSAQRKGAPSTSVSTQGESTPERGGEP